MSTVTNLKNYIWVANDVLTTFPSEQKNYDLEYYSDTNNTLFDHIIFGTDSLSYFITIPMSMPTVYSSSGWMRDALKTARISGGTDVENAELIALLEANGTLVPYMITLDLTTIGLGLGEYTIQMSASDDGTSRMEDSDLSAPLQYTQGYNITVTTTNCSQDSTNPRMINPDETAELHFTFDGTLYVCPETAPTVTGATVDAWQKVDASHGTLVISTATGAVSVTVEGEGISDLTGTVWRFDNSKIGTNLEDGAVYNISGQATSNLSPVYRSSGSHIQFGSPGTIRVFFFTNSSGTYQYPGYRKLNGQCGYRGGSSSSYSWENCDYIDVQITGGSDVTNRAVIAWFQTNANRIS